MEISHYLDATYLKTAIQAGITEKENLQKIVALTKEAINYDYKLVMIRSNYITTAKKILSKLEKSHKFNKNSKKTEESDLQLSFFNLDNPKKSKPHFL